jgi:hypothetical protein
MEKPAVLSPPAGFVFSFQSIITPPCRSHTAGISNGRPVLTEEPRAVVKASTWFSLALAAMGILANIPAAFFSFSLLGSWISLHISHDPYFHYGYFRAALPGLAGSTLGISTAAMTMFRRSSNILLPVFSFGAGLVGVILLPWVESARLCKINGHAPVNDIPKTGGRLPELWFMLGAS